MKTLHMPRSRSAQARSTLATGSALLWEKVRVQPHWKKWVNWQTKSWVTQQPDGSVRIGVQGIPYGEDGKDPKESKRKIEEMLRTGGFLPNDALCDGGP